MRKRKNLRWGIIVEKVGSKLGVKEGQGVMDNKKKMQQRYKMTEVEGERERVRGVMKLMEYK